MDIAIDILMVAACLGLDLAAYCMITFGAVRLVDWWAKKTDLESGTYDK